jgi:hypothetical protein
MLWGTEFSLLSLLIRKELDTPRNNFD